MSFQLNRRSSRAGANRPLEQQITELKQQVHEMSSIGGEPRDDRGEGMRPRRLWHLFGSGQLPSCEGASEQWGRLDWFAAAACALVALTLCVAPHVAMFVRHGTLRYVANVDDRLYLTMARAPYYGETEWRDGFVSRREHVPCIYSWAQIAPGAYLARALGLPLELTALVWKVAGALLLGPTLFAMFRKLCLGTGNATAWALGCTIVGLTDPGFMGPVERFGIEPFVKLSAMIRGAPIDSMAHSMVQYRVLSPLLSAPFFFLTLSGLVPPGPRRPSDVVAGGVGLGLCMVTYFYYWTTAVVVLGGYFAYLVVAGWVRPDRRAGLFARARRVAAIAALGLAIGGPTLVGNYLIFADPAYKPILERMVKGFSFSAADPLRWAQLYNRWFLAKLALGMAGVLVLRDPKLAFFVWVSLVGFALRNSGVVTLREFENNHFANVTIPMSAVLLIGIVVRSVPRLGEVTGRRLARALWAVPVLFLAIAAAWRPYEALHARDPKLILQMQRSLDPLARALAASGPDATVAGPDETFWLLLGSRAAILSDIYALWQASAIPTEEFIERHALNGWLKGLDRARYEEIAVGHPVGFPPYRRPEWKPEALARTLGAVFLRIETDPAYASAMLDRYRPTHLLTRDPSETPVRAGPWKQLVSTGEWTLWERPLAVGVEAAAPARVVELPGP
jgi:hypothetical protein